MLGQQNTACAATPNQPAGNPSALVAHTTIITPFLPSRDAAWAAFISSTHSDPSDYDHLLTLRRMILPI
ncbi:uncharacterized protein FIBRA_07105 [Fibroporia radiculosa]|uniref:Uncharacterized protein n=1 Tax=Fibroporia radiculosa TaxID=599839 RepID=J4GDH5_9APHY|nr:uncharacterized protein FIBRA_07105 [Fibroporia radiculosa]CCM04908.1 predicted protein [Fibroporia radiculosa]